MRSAGAFRSGEGLVADVLPDRDTGFLGGGADGRQLVVSEPDGDVVGARVVGGWSSHLGHGTTIAYPERLDFSVSGNYGGDMTTTQSTETAIEYALMIDWGRDDINHVDLGVEYVPAKSFEHAEEMARKLYAGRSCWTVGRERQPWRYVRRIDAFLTDEVAR